MHAPTDRIWQILIDFESYGEWNPFIYKISGKASVGEKLHIWLRTPGGKERTYEPKVVKVDEGRELRWRGKSFFLEGEHVFLIESNGPAITRFVQKETFKGPLTRFLGPGVDEDIATAFDQMNQALKRRSELQKT